MTPEAVHEPDHDLRLLDRIAAGDAPAAFALIHRPAAGHAGIDLLMGDPSTAPTVADIPLREAGGVGHDVLALLPYRQLGERGFDCRDDNVPLLVLHVTEQAVATVADVTARIADTRLALRDGCFDLDDRAYADHVARIQRDEIGAGAGSNFVFKRSYRGRVENWSIATALALFARLVRGERGAHWTFLIHIDGRTFLGASPERHVGLHGGVVAMNPISGTYRYPQDGSRAEDLLRFLSDGKEADELYMVLDEELKMMSRMCPLGGRVRGPFLHEMAHLAHTGYVVEGRTELDARLILRETMFAPTIIGSPLASACRVVAEHEPTGRSYYGGVAALIGSDDRGGRAMDSAILIRTAEIDRRGELRLDVGATLVRNSDPAREAAETTAKAGGVLQALRAPSPTNESRPAPRLGERLDIRHALAERNSTLSPFWQREPGTRSRHNPRLVGKRLLIVDADDAFTHMGKTVLASLGLTVQVREYRDDWDLTQFDAVIVGPGPGDPGAEHDPKIARLRTLTATLLDRRIPFLAVCLGHQVLCSHLGLPLVRKAIPNQGVQRSIPVFGNRELAYFYNTFVAVHDEDHLRVDAAADPIEVFRDRHTGDIHALRAAEFASVQFHPASVRTVNGTTILENLLSHITTASTTARLSR